MQRSPIVSIVRAFATMILLAVAMPAAAQFSDSYNFLKAVRDKDGAKVTELLSSKGSTLINTRDFSTGESALAIAVKRRDELWVRFLLSQGANPDIKDNQGNTPIVLAAQLAFSEGITALIEGRGDVNLANAQGETPLIIAVQHRDLASARVLLANGANAALSDHLAGMSARDYAARDPRAAAILRLIDDTPKPQAAKPAAIAGPKL